MSAPSFSRRLVLEAPDRVSDGAGGYTESWVARGTVWADIAVRGAGTEARAAVSAVDLKITLRATPQGAPSRPTPGMRFRDGERIYRIEAVTEADTRGRTLICYATEETGA